MATWVINATATGFLADAPIGMYMAMPMEYHSTGGGYGGYYPDNAWIMTFQGAFVVFDATTDITFSGEPGATGGGAGYSMTTGSMSFYRPIYEAGVGWTGQVELIGTGTIPTFTHAEAPNAGYGVWNSNPALVYDLYMPDGVFREFQGALDLEFNGAEVGDFIEATYLSGPGRLSTFNGNGGDDTIYGSLLTDNVIFGGEGDDFLNIYGGGTGVSAHNELFGGEGEDDVYVFGSVGDTAELHGGDNDDFLLTSGGLDLLWGDAGNDTLQGDGNETAVYSGSRADYAIISGSQLATVIDQRLGAADGTDSLSGIRWVQFNDGRYLLSAILDTGVTIRGTAADDIVGPGVTVAGQPFVSVSNDRIFGYEGNDTLDGGLGADEMRGGLGDDTYYVDNVGDTAVETGNGQGSDLVMTSVTFTLGAYVDNLTQTGTGQIDGTGNDLGNKIRGNLAGNTLTGAGGKDDIRGNRGADIIYGDDGNDVLFGGDDNDAIFGGTGADRLDGGSGADNLWGGQDNDTYVVDNFGDQVFETGPTSGLDEGGVDTVRAYVTHHLTDFVEYLYLEGTLAIDGFGNIGNNRITGNAESNALHGGDGKDTLNGGDGFDHLFGDNGVDSLSGGVGDDELDGGAGADRLTGGLGADSFIFMAPTVTNAERDIIYDFVSGEDHIAIYAGGFGLAMEGLGIEEDGTLSADYFQVGSLVSGGHGAFLFNSSTRVLSWDNDGAGGQAARALAVLQAGADLTLADFDLI